MHEALDYAPRGGTVTIGSRRDREQDETRREAFTALVREQDRNMRMLAYRVLGSAAEMDDVLQDAYLKAYRAFGSFRGQAAQSTWLYRIVYNACLDRLRSRAREGARGADETLSLDLMHEWGDELVAPGDLGASVEWRHRLAEALASLPVDRRAAVLLVDALGYDYRSAAEVLGLRAGTVASRVHRARAALRVALGGAEREEER